jgi:hypothetical protein
MPVRYPNGDVVCPSCRGNGCDMCDGHGHVAPTTAILWCELFQTLNDNTTPEEKMRVRKYALVEYGVFVDDPDECERKNRLFWSRFP